MRALTWAFRLKKLRLFRNDVFFCKLKGMQRALQNTLPIVRVKYVATSASKKHLKPFWFTFQCVEGVPAAHQLFYLYVKKYWRILNLRFRVCENKAFYTMTFRYKSMLMCMGWPRKMPVNTSLRICYIRCNKCERVGHTYKMEVWNISLLSTPFIEDETFFRVGSGKK